MRLKFNWICSPESVWYFSRRNYRYIEPVHESKEDMMAFCKKSKKILIKLSWMKTKKCATVESRPVPAYNEKWIEKKKLLSGASKLCNAFWVKTMKDWAKIWPEFHWFQLYKHSISNWNLYGICWKQANQRQIGSVYWISRIEKRQYGTTPFRCEIQIEKKVFFLLLFVCLLFQKANNFLRINLDEKSIMRTEFDSSHRKWTLIVFSNSD